MEWMILPLKRYAQFSGRSRRKEYWLYVLFIVIVSLILSVLDGALGLGGSNRVVSTTGSVGMNYGYGAATRGGLLSSIFSLATLVPSLAVGVRRLHDTDRSGWWILLPVVPMIIGVAGLFGGIASGGAGSAMILAGLGFLAVFICSIIIFVWYCLDGTPGPNRFGEDPKADIPADLQRTFE